MILNHNGLRWLPKCLSSVSKTDYPNCESWIVDNASRDGSVQYVRANYPSMRILQYQSNLGFAEAYNRAIEQTEADYIVLLNNDTEILNLKWVRLLVDVAGRSPRTSAVACKLVSMEDFCRLDSVGGIGIPFWRGFVDIGKGQHDRGQYDAGDFEPFAFCGAAALVKRAAFLKAGGFDARFFVYLEDADLSWRLRLMGYRIGFDPEAKVAHYFAGSTESKGVTPEKLYYCHRNLLRAIAKNCGSSLVWALRNYLVFSFIMTAGFCILQPMKALSVLKAIVWNLFNLRDTYAQRVQVQASRTLGESEILSRMYSRLGRYQPAEHLRLRKILDIIFEHGQSSHLPS